MRLNETTPTLAAAFHSPTSKLYPFDSLEPYCELQSRGSHRAGYSTEQTSPLLDLPSKGPKSRLARQQERERADLSTLSQPPPEVVRRPIVERAYDPTGASILIPESTSSPVLSSLSLIHI